MQNKYLPWILGALVVIFGGYYAYARYAEDSQLKMDKKKADEAALQVKPKIMTVNLATQGTFGQSGTATLMENAEGKVVVTLEMTGGSFTAPQPAHIHVGSCPKPGAVKYPLTNVEGNKSVTTLDVGLLDIENSTERLAINVHKSAADASVYTACGDLPVGSTGTTSVKPATTVPSATPQPAANTGSAKSDPAKDNGRGNAGKKP